MARAAGASVSIRVAMSNRSNDKVGVVGVHDHVIKMIVCNVDLGG